MLFYTFDEDNKYGGYAWFNIHTGVKDQVQEGPYQFRRGVLKARDANQFVSSREDFSTFPDLHISGDNLKTLKKISDANPQQKDFRWGTAELYTWTGADGQEMEGIVIKPEGFDPDISNTRPSPIFTKGMLIRCIGIGLPVIQGQSSTSRIMPAVAT
jgi:dipeptidyl aminopeptidase/acylaminoacyl peptidase